MPGHELIDKKEFLEISDLFKKSKTLFRMGFEDKRKGIFKVNEFEKKFAKKINTKFTLAVSSGTAALRVALASLNLKSTDEVITQSFTFVATVESIVEARAIPVCTEIDDTLNMCPIDLEKKINKNTRAVIVVHMLGVPAKMSEIKKICKKNKIILIEDTAWGCGAKLNNKYLGTIGDIGAFSFDFAKTITTGEGGMISFKSKKLFDLAKAWHDHGHENNPKLPRWEDSRKSSGFNFRMTEMQGAVGIAQLKKLNYIVKNQRKIYDYIWSKIKYLPQIQKRSYPKNSYISADALIFLVNNNHRAKRCREELIKNKMSTKILPEAFTWHFAGEWDHIKQLKIKHRNLRTAFPKSRKIIKRAVSIPINLKTSILKLNTISKSIIEALKI